MNCKKAGIKFLTSSQICCRTALRKLNVQVKANMMQNRLFTVSVYQRWLPKFCFLCLHIVIVNVTSCVKIVCPRHVPWPWRRLRMHATVQWMRQWRTVKCCSTKHSACAITDKSTKQNYLLIRLGRPCTVVTGGLIKCSWCFLTPKIRGALPPKKLGAKNMQNFGRFYTTSNFDLEYLRNGSRYPKTES